MSNTTPPPKLLLFSNLQLLLLPPLLLQQQLLLQLLILLSRSINYLQAENIHKARSNYIKAQNEIQCNELYSWTMRLCAIKCNEI